MLATVRAAHGKAPSRAGTSTRRVHGRLARAAGVLALAALAGCTSMAPRDDLAAEVARYYAAHASEEDGRCTSPEIASVTKRKVLASSAEATRLRVRYSYFDPGAPGATDWTRVLRTERACTGFAERDFKLVRGPLGYQVVEMSGPARAQP
jgi:outer membrane murein-binding lipoprotein Lpp